MQDLNAENRKPFLVGGDSYDWLLSLSKLAGSEVVDVTVTTSREFGEPVVVLHSIVFNNDTELFVEGEHDMPYLAGGPRGRTTKFVVDLEDIGEKYEDDED
jgi:nucleotide-binding universal stress UspA family protein